MKMQLKLEMKLRKKKNKKAPMEAGYKVIKANNNEKII